MQRQSTDRPVKVTQIQNTDKQVNVSQTVSPVSKVVMVSNISRSDTLQIEYPEKGNQVDGRTICTLAYKRSTPGNFTGKIIRNFKINNWMSADVQM